MNAMLEPNDFRLSQRERSNLLNGIWLASFRSSLWFAGALLSCYLGAIVAANYFITRYGQIAVPFVAFALIPFDLVARDLMQDHWNWVPGQGKLYIFKRMVIIILLGATISYLTGTGSLRVNLASCTAFIVAGSIDAMTYQWMIRYGRIFRINGATITAAITDSIIFVSIAFAAVNWKLVGLQIGMKVVGGFCWSLLLYRLFRTAKPARPRMEDVRVLTSFYGDLEERMRARPWGRFEGTLTPYPAPTLTEVGRPELPCFECGKPTYRDKLGRVWCTRSPGCGPSL